jgi:hypothetical protein
MKVNPPSSTQTNKTRPSVPMADYAMETLQAAYAHRQPMCVVHKGEKQLPTSWLKWLHVSAVAAS